MLREQPRDAQKEEFRLYLIDEQGRLIRENAGDFLKNARFYLETLEEFISKEKSAEIAQLQKHADRLPESRRGAFWSYHYPIHWEEIFENQLRSSFIVSLAAFFEDYLKWICWEVAIIERLAEDPRGWRRAILKDARGFLTRHGAFSIPSESDWPIILRIYDLRNVFVHHGGHLNGPGNTSALEQFIAKQPGISESNGFIELEKEVCFFALKVVERVTESLYEQQKAFRTLAAAKT